MSVKHLVLVGALLWGGLASFELRAQGGGWEMVRSERFGFSLLYPANLLQLSSGTPDGQHLEFASDDGRTKLRVFAIVNEDNLSLRQYRAQIAGKLRDYRAIQYGPMGGSWFVLSGVHGGSIFYQKVVFSCGGRIVNAFALTYPREEKAGFDPIVTTIEKSFHGASGPACASAGGHGEP